MRKIFALILAVMLVMSMAISASAYTLNIPKVPQISNIKLEPKLDVNLEKAVENHTENWVSNWISKIDFSKIDFSKFKFN